MAVRFRMLRLTGKNGPPASESQSRVKTYNRIKLTLSLLGTILFFLFAFVVVITGFSRTIVSFTSSFTESEYGMFLAFAGILALMEVVISFPLKFYSGFSLEQKYGLSNQTFGLWLWEQTKGLMLGIPLTVPLLLIFFYCLKHFGDDWWLPVGLVMFLFTTLLARLAPKVIFPLFYKFKPLERTELQDRVKRLCSESGFSVEGIFSFNMSKNTKKANAGFTGIGKSKRVILGDTLLEKFSDDEIETILAHELGHYYHRHIWKGIFVGTVSTFFGLFVTSRLYAVSLPLFGFRQIDDLAALPLLGVWLGVFGLIFSPLTNGISRKHEYEADQFAVRKSQNPNAFVGALKKLANVNLADVAPNRFIEFFFHSHPSIEKRIRRAERELENHGILPP